MHDVTGVIGIGGLDFVMVKTSSNELNSSMFDTLSQNQIDCLANETKQMALVSA